ncbi:hypothetical protein PFICI_11926 [Pestalotiopsis fici W106-1]|uniref:Uncharacterized protein n=1 Tax=Pestalotiopsis fici (strain W106-1 / CGMCC3.15140) TaxID=1229662 RepID=W3WRS8_PESFW|nr:uncharacterized protein PFICI_11926 [Pestalotiopsis fici W106-1]ETS76539.1 hypothetical protein PFICI_11926 [Pestalotiopsis fici W106-1]
MDDNRLFRLLLGSEQHLRAHLEDIKARASRQPDHDQLASVFRASAVDLMMLFRSHYCGRLVDIGIRWLISEILESVALSFLGEVEVYKFKYQVRIPWGAYEVADLGHLIDLFAALDMDVDGYFNILCSNGRHYSRNLVGATYLFAPHCPPGPPRFVEIRNRYFTVRLPAEMMWDEAVKLKQNVQPLLRVAVQLIPSPLSLRFKPYLTDKYAPEHSRHIIGMRRYADALGHLERWIAILTLACYLWHSLDHLIPIHSDGNNAINVDKGIRDRRWTQPLLALSPFFSRYLGYDQI